MCLLLWNEKDERAMRILPAGFLDAGCSRRNEGNRLVCEPATGMIYENAVPEGPT